MAGPEKVCPFFGANVRCQECGLGVRVLSEEDEAKFLHRQQVCPPTHECAFAVTAALFPGQLVQALESLANTMEGHTEAIESYLRDNLEGAVESAVAKAISKTRPKKGATGPG